MAKARHRYKKLYAHFFYWFKTLIGSSKSTLFHENASFPWHIFQINYIILLHQDLSHCFLHTSQFVTACKTMLKYFYHYLYFLHTCSACESLKGCSCSSWWYRNMAVCFIHENNLRFSPSSRTHCCPQPFNVAAALP